MDFINFLLEKNTIDFTKDEVARAGQQIGVDLSKYDYKNVMLGMKVEMKHGSKHGNDVNVTGDQVQPTLKLVIANLRENPQYYTSSARQAIKESLEALTDFELYVDHINAAGKVDKIAAGILPICKETGRILLAKRASNVDYPNLWAGFGGKLEQDKGENEENITEVVKREFLEETAYKSYYSLIPAYIYTSTDGSVKYYNFIGLFENEFDPKLNDEHTEYQWFSLNEIQAIPADDIHFGIKLLILNSSDVIKKFAK
jgi:8-oxo-dGTP pyrophosphatase MutT (NUDIX family)